MNDFFDSQEHQAPAQRERALFQRLPQQIAQAKQNAPALAEHLSAVHDVQAIDHRGALADLPVMRKNDLYTIQAKWRAQGDPLGGCATIGWGKQVRRAHKVFTSPGPLYEPEGTHADYWGFARALYAAGFRAGDLIHNSFSYHLTPAGSMLEGAALSLACTVFPGGVGNTELQINAMADLLPHGYAGTPSFLRILIEQATASARKNLTKAIVSGEAFPPSLQQWLAEYGIDAYQAYGTADLGLIAYETKARQGLILSEQQILEIVRPGTNEVLAEGEIGEVVVTSLNPDYPLIRFGTGDMSALLPGQCPTGRTNTRIKGWLGRADQTAKVKGMFINPQQVAAIHQRFSQVNKLRFIISGTMAKDVLSLHAECAQPSEQLSAELAQEVRNVTRLSAHIEVCAPGALANDGYVIEDKRTNE